MMIIRNVLVLVDIKDTTVMKKVGEYVYRDICPWSLLILMFLVLLLVSPCEGNPCRNDGICIDIENSTFICKCSQLFGGILCEKRGEALNY